MVYDPVFKYGQNFYLVLTEEAKERILNVSDQYNLNTCLHVRGGEWYLEKCGSRKILAGSRNLGRVFDETGSIVSVWFVFTFYESRNFLPKSLGLGFSN